MSQKHKWKKMTFLSIRRAAQHFLLSECNSPKMCRNRRNCSSPVLQFFVLLICLSIRFSSEADTISYGQTISGKQTIVSREGNFELGFFSPGNTQNFYIGIWYKKISKHTVIWVANRKVPVSDTSTSQLTISKDGSLVLLNTYKIPIWSSNSTFSSPNNTVAVLLDTGNFVLRDSNNSSSIVWQSFDHPTDTCVPGSWLGMNKVTGEYQTLTSWRNPEDPSPGPFMVTIDTDGTNQFFLVWNKTQSYWRSGGWNGRYFDLIPGMNLNPLFNESFVNNSERRYFTISLLVNSTIIRPVMEPSGQIKQYLWLDSSEQWIQFWSEPNEQCDVYSACGAFGICSGTGTTRCTCPQGFEPASVRDWNLNPWSSGCRRKTQLQCGGKDGFLRMPNMQVPLNSYPLEAAQSAQDCRLACLTNCSCSAYSFENSGCSVWEGEVRSLRTVHGNANTSTTIYIRLAASDLHTSSGSTRTRIAVIVGGVAFSVIVMALLMWIAWKCLCGSAIREAKNVEGSLVSFTYSDLKRVTKNFTEKLGEGGFGIVYKGSLQDSTFVAVKQLQGLTQGEKQFRAEVSTLGKIQHVNLVRLRGFCSQGKRKLLVYDFMQNGSLASHLFRMDSKVLDWRRRHEIALGIARGLAYLHEECRECIIHCDVKPENVLLDAQNCPKLADFGMAKIMGHDFSRVLTTMRGTIGYLAPEWISGLPISPKSDVYSFGMLLLELISGRRNTAHSENGGTSFFPGWAASMVVEGEVLRLLDARMEGNADVEELSRACRLACWCIQDFEDQRPSMRQAILILEGATDVDAPPVPRFIQLLLEDNDSNIKINYFSE